MNREEREEMAPVNGKDAKSNLYKVFFVRLPCEGAGFAFFVVQGA
jgi:hypothetical protein